MNSSKQAQINALAASPINQERSQIFLKLRLKNKALERGGSVVHTDVSMPILFLF